MHDRVKTLVFLALVATTVVLLAFAACGEPKVGKKRHHYPYRVPSHTQT